MLIEDEELREIFKIASQERLQKLDDGLLHLEKQADDRAKLEEVLREIHSLKGDAGMMGLKEISTLAHQFEEELGPVKRREVDFSTALSDRLYQWLAAIRQLVQQAMTVQIEVQPNGQINTQANGQIKIQTNASISTQINTQENAQIDPQITPQITSKINTRRAEEIGARAIAPVWSGAIAHPEAPIPLLATELPATELSTIELLAIEVEQTEVEPALPAVQIPLGAPGTTLLEESASLYRIETIRVEPQKLDALMTQAGELTVTKTRVTHRLAEVEEISAFWEEWSRDVFVHRFSLSQSRSRDLAPADQQQMELMQTFYQRTCERLEQMGSLIGRLSKAASEDSARLEGVAGEMEEGIRALRLLPLSTVFNLLPRVVRDLAKQQSKQVELVITGGDTYADKHILEEIKDPLMHMIRNAIDHGIESPAERERLGKPAIATIWLRGSQVGDRILIEVTDDGQGLDLDRIRQTALRRGLCRPEELAAMTLSQIQALIFMPGFSTRTLVTEVSGRGVGLDVVRTNVERLKGTLEVESTWGQGCTLRVQMGTTLATAHVLIVEVGGIAYAIPLEYIQTTRLVRPQEMFTLEGQWAIAVDGQAISVMPLADLLEISRPQTPALPGTLPGKEAPSTPCILLKIGDNRLGLLVDALIDEQNVVLKPQSKLLKRVRNVSGATILGTGEVCMILNPLDFIKSAQRHAGSTPASLLTPVIQPKQVILLVEDSIAIRTQEKRILEGAGYEVVTAVDGLDGFNKLKTRNFDAVVTDIQMPNLDGLALTAQIRQLSEYREMPIILVSSLATEEDHRRGAEVGADAYITKGTFDQKVLLNTLRMLV